MKRFLNSSYTVTGISWGALALRVGAGGLMIPYGFYKLQHFAQLSPTFTNPFHLGSPISLILVIFAEFFCSILIILGLLTRLACIPLIIAMSVVVFQVNHGALTGKGDNATLFLTCFIALLFTGPGRISMDRLIGK